MIDFPLPAAVHGDILAADLAAAGVPTGVQVVADRLQLMDLGEPDRQTAAPVVDAHAAKAQTAIDAAQAERANETTIRDKATAALTDNKTFLALSSPTNAQVVAQVKALTRQNNALIRLLLQRFDGAV